MIRDVLVVSRAAINSLTLRAKSLHSLQLDVTIDSVKRPEELTQAELLNPK